MLTRKLVCVALATVFVATASDFASAQSGTRGGLRGSATRSAPVVQSVPAGSATRSAPVIQSAPAGSGTRSVSPAPSSGSGTRIFSSEVPPSSFQSAPVVSSPVTSAPVVSSRVPSTTVVGSYYGGACCGSTQAYSCQPSYTTRRVYRRFYTVPSYTPSYSYYSPAVSTSGCGCSGY